MGTSRKYTPLIETIERNKMIKEIIAWIQSNNIASDLTAAGILYLINLGATWLMHVLREMKNALKRIISAYKLAYELKPTNPMKIWYVLYKKLKQKDTKRKKKKRKSS